MIIKNSTPKKDGYRMPGEYETHSATFMLWPVRPDNWRNNAIPAQTAFANVANAIAEFEPVKMGVNNEKEADDARKLLGDNVEIKIIESNDSWARDNAPTFVINNDNGVRAIDWVFNAWTRIDEDGNLVPLYDDYTLDQEVARKMAEIEEVEIYKLDDFVLEGGAIHVDGEGTILTTDECLLDMGRRGKENPLTKSEVEEVLCEYLGAEKVIWIPRGIHLDETAGHVDNIACFVRPGVIALAWPNENYPKDDPQWEISQEAYEVLSNVTDARGRKLQIEKMLLPDPITITEEESKGVESLEHMAREVGDRLGATYVNYYHVNGAIIVPGFADTSDSNENRKMQDERVVEQLQKLYPDRKIVQVAAREIILGGGNIHCITQQVPKGQRN